MSIFGRYNPKLGSKPMGFARQGRWVMGCKSPPTNLVEPNEYGILGVMGYRVHGLREFRLYFNEKPARD